MSDIRTENAPPVGIVVDGLCKTYRRREARALDGFSIEVRPGEILGLIGPNGAGKTTFLGCLLGFLEPDAGRIEIGGMAPDSLAVRRLVGYLPERLTFDRWMNARAFLRLHHELAEQPGESREEDVAAALMRVQLDSSAWDAGLDGFSRGMLQRLGLAQALIGRPRILLLDEPASGVDPAGVLLFRQLFRELRAEGVTIVLNSHQLDQIERVCDRVAFIASGRLGQIENLSEDAGVPRVLVVRWLSDGTPNRERVAALGQTAGAALLEWTPPRAAFSVPDDQSAAALVRALVEGGVAVAEVAPREGRLERFFT
jgi:ABC-2 type transport system ATP-binding protein